MTFMRLIVVLTFLLCSSLTLGEGAFKKGQKLTLGRKNAENKCKNKHCCWKKYNPDKDLINDNRINCRTLNVVDCVENDKFCEWDCLRNNKAFHSNKIKHFIGFQEEIGMYRELDENDIKKDQKVNKTKIQSINELIDTTATVTMDDCGLIYEEHLTYKNAEKIFKNLEKKLFDISFSNKLIKNELDFDLDMNVDMDKNERRRRMQTLAKTLGIFGKDGRKQIKSKDYPYSANGFLSFQSTKGYSWCTATFISKQVIITAGHCVSSNSRYFTNFKFYPGVTGLPLPVPLTARQIQTFRYWFYYGYLSYDIGLIRLSVKDSNNGYLDFGYKQFFNNPTKFGIMGYAVDKHYQKPYSHWKQDAKYIYFSTHLIGSKEADLPRGSSGSPVYIRYNKKRIVIYCIVSHINGNAYNNCARITEAKYNAICSFIVQNEQGIC